MNIERTANGPEIILTVEGRVDANTSKELQDAIITAFQGSNKLVVDFEKVEYVASAGLRALLLGHKTAMSKAGYMKLLHVAEAVMEVLHMTGFDSILTIE
ncbi:MAG: STAS domain-containing protein [Lachnospiraceae bacterium]|nr:STAS domain-containing protein [Lachnospiraceae bacterium]